MHGPIKRVKLMVDGNGLYNICPYINIIKSYIYEWQLIQPYYYIIIVVYQIIVNTQHSSNSYNTF